MYTTTIVRDATRKLLHSTEQNLTPTTPPEGEWREHSTAMTTCGYEITAPTAGLTWRGHINQITCPTCAELAEHQPTPKQKTQLLGESHPTPTSTSLLRSIYGRNTRVGSPLSKTKTYTFNRKDTRRNRPAETTNTATIK